MKPARLKLLTGLLWALPVSGMVNAAAPLERELIRHSEIRVYGADPRPIGAIDFSAAAGESRRLGPWDLQSGELEEAGRLHFHEGGGISGDAAGRRFQRAPAAGRTCTTHGNLTVCR